MIKVILERVNQLGKIFYIGKCDPRLLVKLTEDIQVGEVQDAQRPLEMKHLQEISKYVGADRGILPSSILISTKQANHHGLRLDIKHETLKIIDELGSESTIEQYFIELPETEKELKLYEGTIDVIDGQHRLFSFKVGDPNLKVTDTYEMTFSLFETPSMELRRKLFLTTNEKQKAVSKNLILWFHEQLGMLDAKEKKFLSLTRKLNTEEYSPLKDRIIMSSEKKTKGYQAKEIVKILKKTFPDTNQLLESAMPDEDTKAQVICNYLKVWEKYYDVSFHDPKKDTITKISGLRYILWWFPTFCDEAIRQDKRINDEFVTAMIKEIEESVDPEHSIFDLSEIFRGEGATDLAVKTHISLWKDYRAKMKKTPVLL